MKRLIAVLGVLAGCTTVSPMQTASALEDGRWRVGAQASAAAYCGTLSGPVPTECTEYPDGVSLPELRVNARRGVPGRADFGLSLQIAGQVWAPSRPIQVGLTFDGKREVWSQRTGPVRQVVSLGLLVAAAVAGRFGLDPFVQAEWGVTARYGVQTARYEWVVGALASKRTGVGVVESARVGLTVGLFRRSPAGWAVQVGYLGDPHRFDAGAIQLQYGVFWDFGGGGTSRDD